MNERLLHALPRWLQRGPVVLASVIAASGATPRRSGSRMLIAHAQTLGSVGGGEAESRVLQAAQALLVGGDTHPVTAALEIALDGRTGAAGVCGGRMQIALRRWQGAADQQRAQKLSDALQRGESVQLDAADLGAKNNTQRVQPDPRLLIIGAGHCGEALYQLAESLDFERCLFDERSEVANAERFPEGQVWSGPFDSLQQALDTPRPVYAVLLSRDFRSDVSALRILAQRPPCFIGMMGSRRRIHEVRQALGDATLDFERIHAPIGLELQAETPHEIAISILAQLIAFRAGQRTAPSGQLPPDG